MNFISKGSPFVDSSYTVWWFLNRKCYLRYANATTFNSFIDKYHKRSLGRNENLIFTLILNENEN